MEYEAKQAIYLPIIDYLNLEFFLMDNRPGVKPGPFVVELVKRWLATETARLALRTNRAPLFFWTALDRTSAISPELD